MAFFNNDLAKGVAIGLGAALLAPLALVAMSGVGRPTARAAIKTGLLMFEKGRETMAELGEVVEDLIAEARAEIEVEREVVNESAPTDAPEAATASATSGEASAPSSGETRAQA